jgi:hypothetical protein
VAQTFIVENVEAIKPLVLKVNQILVAPPDEPSGQRASLVEKISAHGQVQMDLPTGSQAVRRLELSVSPTLSEQQLRSLILVMECDGETNLWCPVTDFFGSGVGLNPVASWYRTVTTNGTLISRWVMPYKSEAHFTMLNLGNKPVAISLRASVAPWQWDERTMYFHSAWHHEAQIQVPPPRDWNFVTLTGRGVYVGDTLALFNPNPAWYGEGDEKIWVDDEKFPSHFGTGTEDYYGYSYAPKPVHQSPFCGEPRIDQPQTQGHNTSIRSRNLDGIPFQKSFQFDMELLPWKSGALTYAATTYWYAFPGTQSNRRPQPDAAMLTVPTLAEAIAAHTPKHFPGAMECEKMKVLAKSGNFALEEQNMEPFGAERWSGGSQLLGKPKAIGDFVELEVPAPDAAPRELLLYATQARDYATLSFSVNGATVPAVFDGYSPEVRPAAVIHLGTFVPRGKTFILRAQVKGSNPSAVGEKYLFGLDCLVLKKL